MDTLVYRIGPSKPRHEPFSGSELPRAQRSVHTAIGIRNESHDKDHGHNFPNGTADDITEKLRRGVQNNSGTIFER